MQRARNVAKRDVYLSVAAAAKKYETSELAGIINIEHWVLSVYRTREPTRCRVSYSQRRAPNAPPPWGEGGINAPNPLNTIEASPDHDFQEIKSRYDGIFLFLPDNSPWS